LEDTRGDEVEGEGALGPEGDAGELETGPEDDVLFSSDEEEEDDVAMTPSVVLDGGADEAETVPVGLRSVAEDFVEYDDDEEFEAEAMTDDGYCEDEADRITDDVLVAPFVEDFVVDVAADSVARRVEEESVGSMPVTLLKPLEVTDGKGKLVLLVPVGATVVEFSNGAEQPYP
jgi:hypothetical protein